MNYGNVLNSSETKIEPKVKIIPPNNSNKGFSTLLMVNLDGNFVTEDRVSIQEKENSEDEGLIQKQEHVLQWLVSNIPDFNSGISEGDTIVPYFQPLAPYGAGYSRIAFLVFRHHSKLNFENLRHDSLKNL